MNTEFAKINHFKWLYHTAYRPQSTGALEVQHRVLKYSLFVAVHQLNVQCPTVLQSIVYMLNSMPNSATRISSFEVVFGMKSNFSKFDIVPNQGDISVVDDCKKQVAARQALRDKIVMCQQKADESMKKTHGPKIIAENIDAGSKILHYRPNSAHAKRHKIK
jgi:hypothetical protein